MKVDKAKLEEFLKTIDPKGCPLCGNNNWILGEYIHSSNEYVRDNETQERIQILPIFPIICSKCGNTYFINAFVSKLLEQEIKKADDNAN